MTRAKIQGIAEPRFFLKMFLRQGDKHGDGRYLSSLRRLVPRDLNRIGYKTPESSDLFVVKRLTEAREKIQIFPSQKIMILDGVCILLKSYPPSVRDRYRGYTPLELRRINASGDDCGHALSV